MKSLKSFIIILCLNLALVGFMAGNNLSPETLPSPIGMGEDTTLVFQYFLDGRMVREGSFSIEDSTLRIVVHGESFERNELRVSINAFTQNELYYNFGDTKGLNFRLHDEIENHLAQYAEESGAIAYAERTGEVPQAYTDYERAYIERMLGSGGGESRSTAIAILHKNCPGIGGDMVTFPGIGLPFMPPSWNNAVSGFTPLFLLGLHKVYDKSFYRKKIATFSGFIGFTKICFTGPLSPIDNKASSWLSFGL